MINNRCFQRYSSCKVLTILSWVLYSTNGLRYYIFYVNKRTRWTTFKIVYKLLFPPFGLPNSSFSSQLRYYFYRKSCISPTHTHLPPFWARWVPSALSLILLSLHCDWLILCLYWNLNSIRIGYRYFVHCSINPWCLAQCPAHRKHW